MENKKDNKAALILKAVGFALCVAAVTLGVLKVTEVSETVTLLGISLLCLWIKSLLKK